TNPAALEPLLNNEPAYPGLYRLSLHDALPIYPAADADDVAGGFGQVDEAVRAHLAQLRVVPAHQRLGVEDAAAVQVDLRLVDQRSEEHTSELQSRGTLVCRRLLEKKDR